MKEEEIARELQSRVIVSEHKDSADYGNDEVNRAIVHSRQDIVLLVSYVNSMIKILKSIRILLLIALFLFAIYLFV